MYLSVIPNYTFIEYVYVEDVTFTKLVRIYYISGYVIKIPNSLFFYVTSQDNNTLLCSWWYQHILGLLQTPS